MIEMIIGILMKILIEAVEAVEVIKTVEAIKTIKIIRVVGIVGVEVVEIINFNDSFDKRFNIDDNGNLSRSFNNGFNKSC